MMVINLLLVVFILFFVVWQFIIPTIARVRLNLRDMCITGFIILVLLALAGSLTYAKAQGKIDIIESYCGKTVSPLSLIFYPEIEDKVILDCENKLAPPTPEVVQ